MKFLKNLHIIPQTREADMTCPNCKKDLILFDLKGIKIQECASCKGKWFARDQLKLAKDRQDDYLRWLDFDPFGQDAAQLSVSSQGKQCPGCARVMSSLTYSQSKIIIDKCASYEGVWLEHGELVRIIRYLENTMMNASAAELMRGTFRQFIEIFKLKNGIVPEVKDFLAVLYLLELRIAAEHPTLVKTSQGIYKYTPFK